MFKEISFCTFLEYYSIMILSKFHSIKKMAKKMVRNMTFSSKMHNGENAFEVLLYLYKQCKHHTKRCIFCTEMDSFWKRHICMDSLIISLHGNVNNSKFIKRNSPESRPAPPLIPAGTAFRGSPSYRPISPSSIAPLPAVTGRLADRQNHVPG